MNTITIDLSECIYYALIFISMFCILYYMIKKRFGKLDFLDYSLTVFLSFYITFFFVRLYHLISDINFNIQL